MEELSEFSLTVIAAAQGKKKQKAKLRKRVAELLDAGYKPTDEDLRALAYYFKYEKRGRPPLVNNPVQKIVREIRDLRGQDIREGKRPRSHAKAFDSVMLGWWLRGLAPPDRFEKDRDQVMTELRRSTRSKN